MYGQNLGVRPDAPGEPIFTKFCMRVRVPDVFLSFEFQEDRVKMLELWGAVEISPLPLKRHIAYTTACCYRTIRDVAFALSQCSTVVRNNVVRAVQKFSTQLNSIYLAIAKTQR